MKILGLLSLLKCEVPREWLVIGFPIIYVCETIAQFRTDRMFFSLDVTDYFFLMTPLMSTMILFLDGRAGFRIFFSSNEFFFTRAIQRSSIFGVKTSLYLLLNLIPLLMVLSYSSFKPALRVELPYTTQEHRQSAKQFYLSHFSGAYVQKDEKDRNGGTGWVVLPKGQIDRALFTLVWVFAYTLVYQAAVFLFRVKEPLQLLPPLLLLYFLVLRLGDQPWKGTPSNYEAGLAWVSQHTLLAFSTLALLAILSQVYCCRQFVSQEIIS